MKGVIDRIEDELAVILIGKEEEAEIYWPLDYLPENSREGSMLEINVELNITETKKRKQKTKNMIDKLKKKHED